MLSLSYQYSLTMFLVYIDIQIYNFLDVQDFLQKPVIAKVIVMSLKYKVKKCTREIL